MAKNTLAEQFQIRPVPKKRKDGRALGPAGLRKAWNGMHECADGMICVYVVGPEDDRLSKVGISIYPYGRMEALMRDAQMPLLMCYFAEMTKGQGRLVEQTFLRECKNAGAGVDGEWVSSPRDKITTRLREIMRENGITPTKEVGDTGDSRWTDATSPARTYVGGEGFSLGITPSRKKRG